LARRSARGQLSIVTFQDVSMRNTLPLFGAIALTVLCWGMYGPVLQAGQIGMSTMEHVPARLRPFVCVGLAYFLIGVIVPGLWLHFQGEKGDWTVRGLIWSIAGGAMGALGALGIILAFTFGGRPVYVMPLVFGGAPVVNAFLTIYLAKRMREIGPWFLAGLIIVILGAVMVMIFAPHGAPAAAVKAAAENVQTAPQPVKPPIAAAGESVWTWLLRVLSIVLAIGSWGAYGPVLHKGQAAMHHSRLRPLICVGLAYFVIAVIVPYFFLGEMGEASTYKSMGTVWSLLGGALGAIGALGIIMAFNSGGKPVFVMPLVFGGAPVINTLVAIQATHQWNNVSPFFWAGLILVVLGAAMVLSMAPRGEAMPAAVPAS
jgi:hypothetical protein